MTEHKLGQFRQKKHSVPKSANSVKFVQIDKKFEISDDDHLKCQSSSAYFNCQNRICPKKSVFVQILSDFFSDKVYFGNWNKPMKYWNECC